MINKQKKHLFIEMFFFVNANLNNTMLNLALDANDGNPVQSHLELTFHQSD